MATPKPGEIRCPTCHRSTPPATFCTQCGSAIPADARIRPRGLDRDELQERIRARRSGADPYHRGGAPGDDSAGYERFEPEPTDRAALRSRPEDSPRRDLLSDTPPPPSRAAAAAASAAGAEALRPLPSEGVERPDLTRERDDWMTPRPESRDAAGQGAPYLAPVADYRENDDADEAYVAYDPPGEADGYDGYDEWEEEPRQRRSAGAGALAILGFLALGVLALLGGAVLAGVFGGDPQVGGGATSSPSISSAPVASSSVAETARPTDSEATGASPAPRASGDPVLFPDGFTADVQPCLPGSADVDGCDSNGSVNGGALDIWVGFSNGTGEDVISAEVFAPDGSSEGAGTMPLARLDCRGTCNGWTYFPFANLQPGTYNVVVTRNSEPAGETSFVVS